MSKFPAMKGLLAACLMLAIGIPVQAQTAAQILSFKPKCDEVPYSTPAAADVGACKLENVKGPSGNTIGYLVTDGKNPLRRFVDNSGSGRIDTWSYFKDGAEVYREAIIGGAYHFRWFGEAGMKWGVGTVDAGGKAKIAQWKQISADEVAQEAFLAFQSNDFDRMKALFLSNDDVAALGLSATEAQRIGSLQKNAQAKFAAILAKQPNLAKATFSRLEGAQPGAYPADAGSKDLIKINRGLILFENQSAAKKNDWIDAPEMILVGNAWRLADVSGDIVPVPNAALQQLLTALGEVDLKLQKATPANAAELNLERVKIVQKIPEHVKADEKENWYKQVIDGLAAAVVAGDKATAPIVLGQWKQQFVTQMPGSNMAAYATYREIWSAFQVEVGLEKIPAKLQKLQEKYQDELAKFVQAFPKCDDAPDALSQLAMGAEFAGKDDEAKKYYGQIVLNHEKHASWARAKGAIRRIDAVGKDFDLTGTTLGTAQAVKLADFKGKAVVVYYWATYSSQATGDFANLKQLQGNVKDVAIVTICLDDQSTEAAKFIQRSGLQAYHLFPQTADGVGMNSRFAVDYGILGLPHLFLIGADGKVVSGKLQVGQLEEEVSKISKK